MKTMAPPLWLALHLPCLPLEALALSSSPSAVVEHGRIVMADAAAQRNGVQCGIGVAAARALAPDITLIARAPEREATALQTLACWAGRFTPHVSLTPDTLLLEIGRCLRLFGGLRQLIGTVDEAAQALDFTLALAAAPTPLAAQWLAQQGQPVFCTALSRLPRYLERLPVSVLPGKAAQALQRFGMTTLGDARSLPPGPLARRIGAESLRRLAQAFGEAPDPRADFVFPERFALSLPLPALVENAAALIFAARRLTSALAGWLAVRQMGVRVATLRLRHESGEKPLPLRFADLTADGERFERVLRERLDRLELIAPVDALCLDASEVAPLPGGSGTLFNDRYAESGSMGTLLERLSARLGETQVYRVAVRDDHRPECATRQATLQDDWSPRRKRPEGSSLAMAGDRPSAILDSGLCRHDEPDIVQYAPDSGVLPRPLWLLDSPEVLREVDGRPYRRGPLELLAGPERIESGWWDEGEAIGDLRRDYFIARTVDERWLWIYRDGRVPGGWFLHGYFS